MSRLRTRALSLNIPGKPSGDALSFSLNEGELWGVLGPNGVGKTTLLHTMAGLRSPRQGSIELEGKPLLSWRRKPLAQQMGLLFQHPATAVATRVAESAMMGRYPYLNLWQQESDRDRALVDNALAQVGLQHFKQRLVETLSGGERQRLEVATLLVQDPTLWLGDEPTNHLDLQQQQRIMQLLSQQAVNGKTVFLALHDINLAAQWCSHILLLYPSGKKQWGTCAEMLTQPLLEALYEQPLIQLEAEGRPCFVPRRR
ncbi:Iron(3+)-hydroxamate import ATP-binding protein FhuC [Halomonadaceae bacterium LMG 33818]|uniref:ABC transporter ATP-binding protein n=1 Tax=Cernens ardua TaxID=3402176 RepID=UPI003EDC051C